jgi:hypothetical protein
MVASPAAQWFWAAWTKKGEDEGSEAGVGEAVPEGQVGDQCGDAEENQCDEVAEQVEHHAS